MKKYIIESKGFTNGLGSSKRREENKNKLKELKRQISEIEQNENNNSLH